MQIKAAPASPAAPDCLTWRVSEGTEQLMLHKRTQSCCTHSVWMCFVGWFLREPAAERHLGSP